MSPGRIVLRWGITLAVAAVLVAAATMVRVALTPYLGVRSPLMLYVAAVLVAGLVRGPLCGALVMLAGGGIGFRMFVCPDGVVGHGAVPTLVIFWGVSAAVLVTASELRAQLNRAMARLSEALDRNSRIA